MKDFIVNWFKNVIAGLLGSKKTLGAVAAIIILAIFVAKINLVAAVICATICFVAWLAAQAYVDVHGKNGK